MWVLDLLRNARSLALLEEDMQDFADLYTGDSLGNAHENEFRGNRRRKAEIILHKAEFISFGALSRKSTQWRVQAAVSSADSLLPCVGPEVMHTHCSCSVGHLWIKCGHHTLLIRCVT